MSQWSQYLMAMLNLLNVLDMSGIAQTIQALTKTCIIKWTAEDMQIIVPGGENDGGVQVWSCV